MDARSQAILYRRNVVPSKVPLSFEAATAGRSKFPKSIPVHLVKNPYNVSVDCHIPDVLRHSFPPSRDLEGNRIDETFFI